jgi:hypothetical protein
MSERRKLETHPLRMGDLERSILIDVRARAKAGLPIPRGYIARRDGSIEPAPTPTTAEVMG